MTCWWDIRWNIWGWWSTWESDVLGLLTAANMRSFSRGTSIFRLFTERLIKLTCFFLCCVQVQGSVSGNLAELERNCSWGSAVPDQTLRLQTWWVQVGQVSRPQEKLYPMQSITNPQPEKKHLLNLFKSYFHFVLRTKIFIRHPRTLFATEDAFQVCKHKLGGTALIYFCYREFQKASHTKLLIKCFLATRIQAKYKGHRVKEGYLRQKEAGEKTRFCFCYIFSFHLTNDINQVPFILKQPQRLRIAGEVWWQGKNVSDEPGLSRWSRSM